MYDDDDGIFMRTTHGVMKNFAYLCKRDRSMTRGKDGWEKVVVCIVSDGRHKINSRMLGVIAAISAYQEGTDINVINSEPVAAHVYEYTTQISAIPYQTKSKAWRTELSSCRSPFYLKEKTRRRSVRASDPSTRSERFFNPTFADGWTVGRRSITPKMVHGAEMSPLGNSPQAALRIRKRQ